MIQCSPRSPKLELKLEPPASATTGAYRLWMSALQANPGAQTHTERHALIHTSSQTNQPTQKWNWMRLGRFGLTMCMLSYVTGVVGGRGEDAWPLGSLAPSSNFLTEEKTLLDFRKHILHFSSWKQMFTLLHVSICSIKLSNNVTHLSAS